MCFRFGFLGPLCALIDHIYLLSYVFAYKEKMVVGCRRDSHDMSHEFSARQYPRCSKKTKHPKRSCHFCSLGVLLISVHTVHCRLRQRYTEILIYEELKITIRQLGLHTLSRLRRRAGSAHVRHQPRSQTRSLARMLGHIPPLMNRHDARLLRYHPATQGCT